MRRWPSTLAVSAAVCAALAGPVTADDGPPPTTAPATAGDDTPAPVPFAGPPLAADSPVRRWFDQLAAPDPAARASAQYELMGMNPGDLPGLRLLVRDKQAGLTPGQVAALHEVVMQVYLSGLPYVAVGAPADPDRGLPALFLGIRSQPGVRVDEANLGVSIGMRYPGFPSYRLLRDGDVILNAVFDPKKDPSLMPNLATHSFEQLVGAIGRSGPHYPLTLIVLRDGQEITRPVVLVPRPVFGQEGNGVGGGGGRAQPDGFMAERANQAESLWQEQFQPLVDTDPPAAAAAE